MVSVATRGLISKIERDFLQGCVVIEQGLIVLN